MFYHIGNNDNVVSRVFFFDDVLQMKRDVAFLLRLGSLIGMGRNLIARELNLRKAAGQIEKNLARAASDLAKTVEVKSVF